MDWLALSRIRHENHAVLTAVDVHGLEDVDAIGVATGLGAFRVRLVVLRLVRAGKLEVF